MEIRGSQSVQQTAPIDHQNMEGCQHGDHLKNGDRTVLPRYISSFRSWQDSCYHPTEQTLKPNNPRGGARDVVRLSFEPDHSGHDVLPAATPGKEYRARSTSVYGHCRLHESIRHRW